MLRALSSRTPGGGALTAPTDVVQSKPIEAPPKTENWSLSSNSDVEEVSCSPCEDVVIRF
ncbi:unnamed protein product [Cylicostephanus goldi]|uniref:Uncharacterized protein n=1 Tax=Cylicostephanus goldi TaxID=71465 RepID=A0A3P7NNZ9_CYLGO|nr:unnamed protein product [Cylicostephanus goldi]